MRGTSVVSVSNAGTNRLAALEVEWHQRSGPCPYVRVGRAAIPTADVHNRVLQGRTCSQLFHFAQLHSFEQHSKDVRYCMDERTWQPKATSCRWHVVTPPHPSPRNASSQRWHGMVWYGIQIHCFDSALPLRRYTRWPGDNNYKWVHSCQLGPGSPEVVFVWFLVGTHRKVNWN